MAGLCAQAMCLEEMLLFDIPEGGLYYGEIRCREVVQLVVTLQTEVTASLEQMYKKKRFVFPSQIDWCNAFWRQ